MYICPVCGYDELEDPPARFEICPSCGTEFGNDNYFDTHSNLRLKWILNGMRWWDDPLTCPENYDPIGQLERLATKL